MQFSEKEFYQNKCVELFERGLTTAACGSALKAGGAVSSRVGIDTSVLGQLTVPAIMPDCLSGDRSSTLRGIANDLPAPLDNAYLGDK